MMASSKCFAVLPNLYIFGYVYLFFLVLCILVSYIFDSLVNSFSRS